MFEAGDVEDRQAYSIEENVLRELDEELFDQGTERDSDEKAPDELDYHQRPWIAELRLLMKSGEADLQ
jgi:hypothetical protein